MQIKFILFAAVMEVIIAKHLHYQQMQDGTFIVAVSKNIASNQTRLQLELGKYFHLSPRHQKIQNDLYPRNGERVNIEKSRDRNILRRLKNVCLNGEDVSTLDEKIDHFKSGKCSPVVIVPGILATSLVLSINCRQLMNYKGGKIFGRCGWTSCNFLGLKTPESEYLIWVGLELTLKVTSGFTKCFGDLFGLIYDSDSKSDDLGNRYHLPSGLKSTWLGNDEYTNSISKCGSNAIRDLSGYISLLSIMGSQCALKDYGRLLDMLEVMGYEPGLTLQALPYDFRYGVQASQTPKLFPQIVNNLYRVTGKKVVVIGHSLGTVHTLSGLAFSMSEEEKRKMVRHYIPITPPWLGTVSAIRNLLYGDQSYFSRSFLDFGINRYAQMKFTSTAGSTYDLFLKDAFSRFRNESWMQDIIARVEYEKVGRTSNSSTQSNSTTQSTQSNSSSSRHDYPLNWFPSKDELCFDPGFKYNPYCETGLIDFESTPIFEIKGKNYYGNKQSITDLLRENMSPERFKQSMSLWEQTMIPGKSLSDIPAPLVNTSMIFTTLFKTQVSYQYKMKPQFDDNGGDNEFVRPESVGFAAGDISVPSFSPLVFVSKWIAENSNKNHSVQVIEYCGKYNGTKKHYSTLTCQCYENSFKNALDCTHPCIISDKYLIAFAIGILTNQDRGYVESAPEDAMDFTTMELERMQRSCINLHPRNKLHPLVQEDESL